MVELAEIFRQHGSTYRQKHTEHMLPSHHQAMRAIEQCRTEALGGHIYQCPDCGEEQYSYHSCRNRHCPKCQNNAAQEWLEKQSDLLLPTPYFMLTFTLPEGLRRVARRHQKLFYNLLFRTSAAATQKLAQDPRFIGGQVGTARNAFLLPVKALAKIFRAKFRQALRKLPCYEEIPSKVWRQPWIVHCKAVGDGASALKYLAPYIFRVAISNNRIVKMSSTHVTFRYRSTKTGKTKTCPLSAEEFIRRFLQHVLPKGFVKVRYYGFLSPGLRNRLASLRTQLERWQPDQPSSTGGDPQTIYQPVDHPVCPACGQVMQKMKTIPAYEHKPP
jgi:hypothetical protein